MNAIQSHSAVFAARATVRGSISLAGLARESEPVQFLDWANTYHREIQSLFALSCKAKSQGKESFSIDGEVFTCFDITVRDQAIASLSANMRKVSSRYKDVEGHFLATHRVAWKSKKGFHLVERKTEEKDDGKDDGKDDDAERLILNLTAENNQLKALLAEIKAARSIADVRKLLAA